LNDYTKSTKLHPILQFNRRRYITSTFLSSILFQYNSPSNNVKAAAAAADEFSTITTTTTTQANMICLPLEPRQGGVLSVRVTINGNIISSSSGKQQQQQPYRVYRVIIDTGSPYLVLPSISDTEDVLTYGILPLQPQQQQQQENRNNNGWFTKNGIQSLFRGNKEEYEDEEDDVFEFTKSSLYKPTQEIYGSVSGFMNWNVGTLQFRDEALQPRQLLSSLSQHPTRNISQQQQQQQQGGVILGVMDEALTKESGGALLGLVKYSNTNTTKIDIRPTFLQQECINGQDITSFTIDGRNRLLTLSTASLLPKDEEEEEKRNIMPLVDLRPLGDFVQHYACVVDYVIFDKDVIISEDTLTCVPKRHLWQDNFDSFPYNNDQKGIKVSKKKKSMTRTTNRKIIAVFDTGLTGCLLTQPFWDELCQEKQIIRDDGDGGSSSSSNSNLDPSTFTSVQVKIRGFTNTNNHRNSSDNTNQKVMKGANNNIIDESLSSTTTSYTTIGSSINESRLFYINPILLDWFDDDETAPHVIVLGQTFLGRGALTIDMDDHKAFFESNA